MGSPGAVGLTVWLFGAAFVFLGLRRRTPLPLLTEAVGALAVVVGTMITTTPWPAFGLVFALATAGGLVALALVRRVPSTHADQLLLGVIGGVALVEAGLSALVYFGRDAGIVTGLTTWLIGGALLFISTRPLVRLGLVVEILGGLALVGGAALTGIQAPGFASIFGIATAIGLVALGMLPGQSAPVAVRGDRAPRQRALGDRLVLPRRRSRATAHHGLRLADRRRLGVAHPNGRPLPSRAQPPATHHHPDMSTIVEPTTTVALMRRRSNHDRC